MQIRANELEEERYNTLIKFLSLISAKVSGIYKKIVPGADCYLSYASNPISLFQEGAILFAQYGQSSWREVLKYMLLIKVCTSNRVTFYVQQGEKSVRRSAGSLLVITDSGDTGELPVSALYDG